MLPAAVRFIPLPLASTVVVVKLLPPVKLKLPILADVNAPILVIPTPAEPVIISTPLNLSELAPVKFKLTFDVQAFVALRHNSSLVPFDDATVIPA